MGLEQVGFGSDLCPARYGPGKVNSPHETPPTMADQNAGLRGTSHCHHLHTTSSEAPRLYYPLRSASPGTNAKQRKPPRKYLTPSGPALCEQRACPAARWPPTAAPPLSWEHGESSWPRPGPRLPGGTDRPGAGGGGVSGFPGVGEVGEWREGRRSVSAGGPPQGAGLQLLT